MNTADNTLKFNENSSLSIFERSIIIGIIIFSCFLYFWQISIPYSKPYISILPAIFGGLTLGFNFIFAYRFKMRKMDLKNPYKKAGLVLWIGNLIYIIILFIRFIIEADNFVFSVIFENNNYLLLLISICASIIEEFFFRKLILQNGYNLQVNQRLFNIILVIQSLIWTSFHFQYYSQPIKLFFVFILGINFGLLHSFSRSIKKPIFIHILSNIIGILYNFSQLP